ncbi:hypothetical protein [Brachybacterium nesterenkovii]|uniref:hypothetical protein n=1 Tax=Brachybacterium nesterenkovii TaxID=47847 RepID=UPI00321A3C38
MTADRAEGLNHPESLELWQDWARSRTRARRAKHAVSGALGRSRRRGADAGQGAEPAWVLRSREGEDAQRLLIAIDAPSPTSRAALLAVLPYLRCGVDVLSRADLVVPELTGEEWSERRGDADELLAGAEHQAVVSTGHNMGAGARAHELARSADVPELVIQHGALTPFAPPLPPGATLLAWSDADAEFWRSGRPDVTTRTVGSQLLWQAGHESGDVDRDARPVFLGQMHGAELPRRLTAGTAYRFCRMHEALYRPHPAETDALSRAAHALMRRRGIAVAPTDVPLRELTSPVVAIFSTGVLEAAARGVPAWVHCPDAPGWVHEFWRRYDMRPFGGTPTPPLAAAEGEPAVRIAGIIEESV